MFNSNDGSNSVSLVHPTAVLNDSNWHHLICTYEIGVGLMRLYLDGQLTNQHESSDLQSILILEGTLFIGKDEILGYGNRHWQGHIDDIGIWNRALTEAEVSALFSGTPPLFGCTDPSACNFNPEATSDDGSCVPAGCTDPASYNYDAEAGCDDGSCAQNDVVTGCLDPAACNFSPGAMYPADCDYSCVCTSFEWMQSGPSAPISGITQGLNGGYIVKTSSDIYSLSDFTSPWESLGFDAQTSFSGEIAQLLGYNAFGELFTSTNWDCFYKRTAAGTWVNMGMCGFGTGGHWWTHADNGRILMTKGGFLRNIYKSDDQGTTWQALNSGYEDWHNLFRAANGDFFASGGGLGVIRIRENGNVHSLVTPNFPVALTGTSCVHGTESAIYAAANGNKLFASTDWGDSWSLAATAPTGFSILIFRFFSENDALVQLTSGSTSRIYHLNVPSQTWTDVHGSLPALSASDWIIPYVFPNAVALSTRNGLFYSNSCLIPGCTDPSACNFNPEATANDGSCVPSGCMDAAACNYDAMAGCDDGSCAPAGAVPGCMEAAACNYDAAAVCAGTCVYPAAGGSDCAAGGVLCGAGTVWDVASQTCIADPTLLAEAAAEAVAEALDGVCGEGTVWHPTLGVCVPWQSCPDWPYNPDSDADGSITVIDLLALLAIFEDVDSDGDGLFDSTDDCDGVYDACGVCGGVGLDADADGVCDDADPCVGALDACGVCNGPGPNVAVLDQIIYATDSLLVPQLGVWYVYEYPIDTLYTYECPQPECSTTSLDTYNVGAPLASFYLDYAGPGPSSYNAGSLPAGAYALQVSGTWCIGSCWSGHTADAAFTFPPFGEEITQAPFVYVNDPCLSGDNECQNNRPFPDEYNEQHIYVFYFQHPGGELSVFGYNDGWWYDNQGGLSFQLFECTGN
jgi:hypothetical protein